jgi:hypothetical protein
MVETLMLTGWSERRPFHLITENSIKTKAYQKIVVLCVSVPLC